MSEASYDDVPDVITTPTGEEFPQPELVLVANKATGDESLVTAKMWRADLSRSGDYELVAGDGAAGTTRTAPKRGNRVPRRPARKGTTAPAAPAAGDDT